MSAEVEYAPDAAQQLRETCHDMRQPIASILALAAAALTEPGPATRSLRSYIRGMLAKLGAHTRLEAAVLAARENLLGEQTA